MRPRRCASAGSLCKVECTDLCSEMSVIGRESELRCCLSFFCERPQAEEVLFLPLTWDATLIGWTSFDLSIWNGFGFFILQSSGCSMGPAWTPSDLCRLITLGSETWCCDMRHSEWCLHMCQGSLQRHSHSLAQIASSQLRHLTCLHPMLVTSVTVLQGLCTLHLLHKGKKSSIAGFAARKGSGLT